MNVLVFDTETDGLIINSAAQVQPRIVEIFCLPIEQNGVGDFVERTPYHSLVNPERLVKDEIIRIHNINNDMLQDAPTFAAVGQRVVELIDWADRLVAHNCMFDVDILDMEFKRVGIVKRMWPELFCTVEQTEHWFQKRLSLGTNRKGQPGLYQILFNEDFKDAHRAEADVRALARCYQECERKGWNYHGQEHQGNSGHSVGAPPAGQDHQDTG